jgi:hypothetical protein
MFIADKKKRPTIDQVLHVLEGILQNDNTQLNELHAILYPKNILSRIKGYFSEKRL